MSEAADRLRTGLVDRALLGPGVASTDARRAAFENRNVDERARALIDKVARNAWTVTDDDVATTKEAGMSEDEIFELVVCAALGQAARQLTAALSAVDAATDDTQAARPQAAGVGGAS